jgi:uncharacterized membrane-anchored protein YjiN (DUF445 family)
MLTYTSTLIKKVTTTTELKAPSDWDMYTKAGDKSLQKKAQLLINKIENSKTEKQIHNAIAAFIKSYRRMSKSKTMSEASDTAVRECVFSFLEKVARCTGIDIELLETIWYENS